MIDVIRLTILFAVQIKERARGDITNRLIAEVEISMRETNLAVASLGSIRKMETPAEAINSNGGESERERE